MAISLQALLNIRANVQGEGAVAGLSKAIGGIQQKAGATSGALRNLTGAAGMGGLAGAMSTLTPLLSAAGLGAMAKGAIDAADNMNDLRQKTGVSVEALSQFGQAAQMSGTTIDGVAAAMARLARGMTAVKGPAVDAMAQLGISSTDAAGKVKGVDQVMLEVADRFAAMPDGAQKTALALQLFGKAGADMIPMLNMGSQAIRDMGVTMSGDFAAKADNLNDSVAKIQASFTRMSVQLATALMPALQDITTVVGIVADGFSRLPAPLQTLIVSAGLLAITLGPIVATISTIVGLITTLGPALAAIGGVIAGVISWPVVLVAALVAAGVALWTFRDQVGAFFTWLGGIVGTALAGFNDALFTWFVQPWVTAWEKLKELAGAGFEWLRNGWQSFSGFVSNVFANIGDRFRAMFVEPITNAIGFVIDAGKRRLRVLLEWAVGAVNAVIGIINRMIGGINRLRGAAGQSPLGLIGTVQVPQFAAGGYVTRPTLGLIGEGGESEYVIPASRMAAASTSYLAGARGAAVLAGRGGGDRPVNVSIQTGPVMQSGGQEWVSKGDLSRAVTEAVRQTKRALLNPGVRADLGMG